MGPSIATQFIVEEAHAMLTRLDGVLPFALTMPFVSGAAISDDAWLAIERRLARDRGALRRRVRRFARWLGGPAGRRTSPRNQQRRFAVLKLQFNAVLDALDIFADALTQRAEHQTGVWLAGLDAIADDALRLRGGYFDPPPVITYLDRGHGAAVRRARTRLPGGRENPVAIIRIPRERMVGIGVASSLIHEVGHQGAALLSLVPSLRGALQARAELAVEDRPAWVLIARWISEIAADYWAILRLGVTATLGLIGVVSLPRAFVFRIKLDDPHPFPWIRVMLSCSVGRALYPDPQWDRLEQMWTALYPPTGLPANTRRLLDRLQSILPAFARLLRGHRPVALRGHTLPEVMGVAEQQPNRLRSLMRAWRRRPQAMCAVSPTLVVAVLGQARADRTLSPRTESRLLSTLLRRWALQRKLGTRTVCGLLARAA